MNRLNTGIFSIEYRAITLGVLVVSLLLSAWGIWVDDVINNDGVEYVRAARLIEAGDIAGSLKVFKWPAYPSLLALTSTVTGLSHEYSAHVVNALFIGVLLLAFLATVLELGADRRTYIAAAIVILLAPRINDWRPFVIRDPAYLAFYTLAMLFMFRQIRYGGIANGLKSLVMMLGAVAFRMEGIAFIVLMPLMLAFSNAQNRSRRAMLMLAGGAACLVLTAGFVLWFVSLGGGLSGAREVETLGGLFAISWEQLTATLADKLHVIEEDLLGKYSADYSVAVLLLTLVVIVFTEVIKSVSLWTGLLVFWAWSRDMLFPVQGMRKPWLLLLLVHMLVLIMFTLVKLFLSERYSLALTVTLLLAAPFGLLGIYELWRRNVNNDRMVRYAYPVLVFLIVVAGIESLGLFTEKRHVKAAGHWVSENARPGDRLFTNSKILAHYAEPASADVRDEWHQVMSMVRAGDWKNYRYLAIRVGRHKTFRAERLIDAMKLKPLERFKNERDDLILVFRTADTG